MDNNHEDIEIMVFEDGTVLTVRKKVENKEKEEKKFIRI